MGRDVPRRVWTPSEKIWIAEREHGSKFFGGGPDPPGYAHANGSRTHGLAIFGLILLPLNFLMLLGSMFKFQTAYEPNYSHHCFQMILLTNKNLPIAIGTSISHPIIMWKGVSGSLNPAECTETLI